MLGRTTKEKSGTSQMFYSIKPSIVSELSILCCSREKPRSFPYNCQDRCPCDSILLYEITED